MARPKSNKPKIDFTALSQKEVAGAFGLTPGAVNQWENCPRNEDNSYSLPAVIRYRIDREIDLAGGNTTDKKNEKLTWEIKRLEAQVNKINDNYIDRTLHEQILVSRANSLNSYLEKSFMANIGEFAMRSVDELRVKVHSFIGAMMKAYTGQ